MAEPQTTTKTNHLNFSHAILDCLYNSDRGGITPENVKAAFEPFARDWASVRNHEDAKQKMLNEVMYTCNNTNMSGFNYALDQNGYLVVMTKPSPDQPPLFISYPDIENQLDYALSLAASMGLYQDFDHHYASSETKFMSLTPTPLNISKAIDNMYAHFIDGNMDEFDKEINFLKSERTEARRQGKDVFASYPVCQAERAQKRYELPILTNPGIPKNDFSKAVSEGYSEVLANTFDAFVTDPTFIQALAKRGALPSGSLYNDPLILKSLSKPPTPEDFRHAIQETMKEGAANNRKDPFKGAMEALAPRLSAWKAFGESSPDSGYRLGAFMKNDPRQRAFSVAAKDALNASIFSKDREVQVRERTRLTAKHLKQETKDPEVRQKLDLFETHPIVASAFTASKLILRFAAKTTKTLYEDIKYVVRSIQAQGDQRVSQKIMAGLHAGAERGVGHVKDAGNAAINALRAASLAMEAEEATKTMTSAYDRAMGAMG